MKAISIYPVHVQDLLIGRKRPMRAEGQDGRFYTYQREYRSYLPPAEVMRAMGWVYDPTFERWQQPDDAGCVELAIHACKRPVDDLDPRGPVVKPGHIVAVASLAGFDVETLREDGDTWQAYSWMLADVVPLAEPLPCVGQVRMWNVPPLVEAAIRRQILNICRI